MIILLIVVIKLINEFKEVYMKYIVLLREINISGKNKISMSELKNELLKNYQNVLTYLNSGNIILDSDKDREYIIHDIYNMIKKRFNLDIPVFVITSIELKNILKNGQKWWVKTASTSIKDKITIRTANTMKKILELCAK